MAAPALWAVVACTTVQLTVLLYGFLRYAAFISFCCSTSSTGRFDEIKNALIICMYAYLPATLVCGTFSYVSFFEDWPAGYFFVWFPFAVIVAFVLIVVATKNDVSNTLDAQRHARALLPGQKKPPVFVGDAPTQGTPPRQLAPPVIPIQATPMVPDASL